MLSDSQGVLRQAFGFDARLQGPLEASSSICSKYLLHSLIIFCFLLSPCAHALLLCSVLTPIIPLQLLGPGSRRLDGRGRARSVAVVWARS